MNVGCTLISRLSEVGMLETKGDINITRIWSTQCAMQMILSE